MTADDDKQLVIDKSGVRYREKGTLGWMQKEFDWNEVDSVEVDDINNVNASTNNHPIELMGHLILNRDRERGEDRGRPSVFDEIFAETGIAVDPNSARVSFDPEKSDAENFKMFFKYMVENDYISRSGLPFRTDRQENFILNTEARHPDSEMRRGVEVADDVWLETSVPINQKKHHILEAVRRYIS